jgi:hypothetical protein
MSNIRWGGIRLAGLTAGVVLIGLSTVSLSGCSRSAASSPDEAAASALSGSSMSVQGAAPAGSSAVVAAAAGATLASYSPDSTAAVPAMAVSAPVVPPVTSPTIPALAAVAPVNPSPVAPSNLAVGSSGAAVVASTDPSVLKGLGQGGMQGTVQALNPAMMHALKEFHVASAAFPDFCREWQHKLSVREHDNLGHIKWVKRDGVETGSYVGYGAIDSCTCKEATNGVAVGVLTYKEFDYTLTGKSVEEARHAAPHATSVVPTREIFAYEKGKWFW